MKTSNHMLTVKVSEYSSVFFANFGEYFIEFMQR